MTVSIIAALAANRVIGRDGGLPWHLPADLARFKSLTTGHSVIMGRRTYASLPRPLPDRVNIVVTRRASLLVPTGVLVARSLPEALALAGDEGTSFVAGGSEIYTLAFAVADRMDLTLVHAEVEGDTFFPPFEESAWRLVEDLRHEADDRHRYPFSFRTYVRAAGAEPASSG